MDLQTRVASLEHALATAEARLTSLREQPKKMMREGATSLAAAAAAPMGDADFESVRAMRKMPQPSPTVQLVARCACSILSCDLPGSKKLTSLLSWDEAKKILSRTDFALCMKQFNAAKLIDQVDLVALVAKRARWAAASSEASADTSASLTLASAFATSAAVGALFGWCSRLLAGLDALKATAVPSAEALEATRAAERQLSERQAEWEGALASLRRAEQHAEEERLRFEAAERARKEAAEKARREAEAKARREAEEVMRREEERARRAAAEKARREAEDKARREAAEKARREAEAKARREAEEARRAAEERARREAEECARREAEERARREADEAEAALREVEAELRRVEESAKVAEQRELNRKRAFERYLATESKRLERELSGFAQQVRAQTVCATAPEQLEAEQAADERAMGQLLEETREGAIDELLALAPNAGRDRCRALLERCDWNAAEAACELLAD